MTAIETLLMTFADNMGFKFDPKAPSHLKALEKTLADSRYKLVRSGMKTVYLLHKTYGEYDAYTDEVVGVVTDKAAAHAYVQINMGSTSSVSHEMDTLTLDVLDKDLRARIDEFLDPVRNPLCECGHRKLHHRERRRKGGRFERQSMGSCKWNVSYQCAAGKHKCKEFKLAKEQPKIEF